MLNTARTATDFSFLAVLVGSVFSRSIVRFGVNRSIYARQQFFTRRSVQSLLMLISVEDLNLYLPSYLAAACILHALKLTVPPELNVVALESVTRIQQLLELEAVSLVIGPYCRIMPEYLVFITRLLHMVFFELTKTAKLNVPFYACCISLGRIITGFSSYVYSVFRLRCRWSIKIMPF